MSDILLATKIHIPSERRNLVNRPRLIQRLNDGIAQNCRLMLVSAPAGYGKSTLLSEWVSRVGIPVAWLSLEKGDNNPIRFWNYFVSALHTIPCLREANVGASILQALRSPSPTAMDVLLANLVNDLSGLKERVVLALDDLHAITTDQINQDLVFLIEHLPLSDSGLRLVVASRMDPPWPLARWRVRSELVEVRARDLRFSAEETETFLNDVMGLKLAASEIAQLDQRTEGWIAGLQMAALSMQSQEDIAGFLKGFTGSHRFILDYLIEEVLSQQKPEILNFLLKTSILERLTAPLCDAVTKGQDSQALLVQLEKSNMFLVSLDNERCWYRYHHLFAGMLYDRLKQAYPEIIPALHGEACRWYTDNGFLAKALTHAIAMGDLDRLSTLVERYAFSIVDLNEASTILTWLSALPDQVMDSYPWLCIAQAWLLAYLGSTQGIEQAILRAEKQTNNENSRLLGYIAAMRTLLAELCGDTSAGPLQARRAFDLIPQGEYRPRAFVSYHLSNILAWRGDVLSALQALEDASTWGLAAGDMELAMSARFEKANLLRFLGRLSESLRTFESTFQMAETSYPAKKYRSLPEGYAYLQLSLLYYEWNNISEALRRAREGIRICREWGYSDYLYNGLMTLANVYIANGDLGEALSSIREAESIFPTPPKPKDRMSALEAVINLARGDLESAATWANNSGLSARDTLDIEHWTEYYHFSTVLTAQGKLQEAYAILQGLRDIMEKARGITPLLKILAQQIMILCSLREDEKVLSLLAYTLRLAEPEGYIHVFISKGEPMRQLLLRAAKAGLNADFVNRLLENYPETTSATPLSDIHPPSNVPGQKSGHIFVEPLSDQEMKVLKFLNTHLTVPEIAQEMFIAPSTTRTHVRNIYDKLGVHGRLEALQKAKVLGLL